MARRINTHPHLNIEHVNRWNATIGPDQRKVARKSSTPKKQDPIDPEDDFMIETDPADKPIDEATIDDTMETYTRLMSDWTEAILDSDEDWADQILSFADMIAEDHPEDYSRIITERFKAAENAFAELYLPRAITHDMLMQIGMRTGVDYKKDTHTHRVYFEDPALNDIILYAYDEMLKDIWGLDDGNEPEFTKQEWVNIIVNTYFDETSNDSQYEILLQEYMYAYDITPEFSDKGNPIGSYRDFIHSFNKVYKNAYKKHLETEDSQMGAWTFSEILSEDLPAEMSKRAEAKKEGSRKAKAKREANKLYKHLYSDEAMECCFGNGLTEAEKFKVRDEIYQYQYGYSYYDDLL